MKNQLTFIITFFSVILLHGQNPYNQLMKGEPDGENIARYSNGQIMTHFFKKNGNVTGVGKEYWKNGQLKNIYHMVDGVSVDTDKCFYENGKLRSIDAWNNDTMLYSEIIFFNLDGTLFNINKYYLKDLNISFNNIDTHYRDYIVKDVVFIDRSKLAKLKNAKSTEEYYYKNGKKSSIDNYKSGERDGEQIRFYENGKVERNTTYMNGLKEGPTIFYDKTGNIIKTKCYHLNKEVKCN